MSYHKRAFRSIIHEFFTSVLTKSRNFCLCRPNRPVTTRSSATGIPAPPRKRTPPSPSPASARWAATFAWESSASWLAADQSRKSRLKSVQHSLDFSDFVFAGNSKLRRESRSSSWSRVAYRWGRKTLERRRGISGGACCRRRCRLPCPSLTRSRLNTIPRCRCY